MIAEDIVRGYIGHPYSLNVYSYCFNNPLIYVDLDGQWPSLTDIGNGIKDAANAIGNAATSAANAVGNVAANAWDWTKRVGNAFVNSIEVEGSYGVGLEGKVKVGPAKANVGGAAKQTHSYTTSEGDYNQRNHVTAGAGIDLWKDKLGARAGISSGWTYSGKDGYVIVDGKIIPITEWMARVYAGNASGGWGYDGRSGDWKIGLGAGIYIIIGWDFEINFNITEFMGQMKECE